MQEGALQPHLVQGSCSHLPKGQLTVMEGAEKRRKRRGPRYLCNLHALQKGKPRLRAGSLGNKPRLADSCPLSLHRQLAPGANRFYP